MIRAATLTTWSPRPCCICVTRAALARTRTHKQETPCGALGGGDQIDVQRRGVASIDTIRPVWITEFSVLNWSRRRTAARGPRASRCSTARCATCGRERRLGASRSVDRPDRRGWRDREEDGLARHPSGLEARDIHELQREAASAGG